MNDAVGAVVSTVMKRVEVTLTAKLLPRSLIAFAFNWTEPLVPVEQFATANV